MWKSLDPGTLAALQTLVTGAVAVVSAFVWGIWDRRNRDKKEAREGSLGERQALSKDMQEFIEGLQKDRDYHNAQSDINRQAKDACFYDRDNVWGAWRIYSQLAHDMRHEAISVVYRLCLQLGADYKAKENQIPDLPNIQDVYHTEKRRKENNP